ncbi:MAG: Hpt domain-containing protein [Magnetospirillum sp.]|nr:Hpt domain-containing protein [Magnetospirillum sp.]
MTSDSDIPGVSVEAMARAEAALAGLNQRYISWAEADLIRLQARLEEVSAAGSDATKALADMFTISHDMKGQAATFGYPLVTELGNRLCRLIEASPHPDGEQLARLQALVAALAQIIATRLGGDGGETGRALLEGL